MKRNNAKSEAHAASMFDNMMAVRMAMRVGFEANPPSKQESLRAAAILAAMRCDYAPKQAMTRALNEHPVNHWGNEVRHLNMLTTTNPATPR